MHNRKKLNIGISSLILGALFLEFNVSQVKADNVKTSLNHNEQTNTKVINQNDASRNNAIAQNSVTNSKFNASLVSSSNNQNDLDKKLVGAQETKNNIEIILLENCGITINQNERNSSYRSEEYRKKSIKHVTKYLSKNNWLHMPAEDYERLYKYYIQDMVSVFLQYHIDKIKALPGQCFIFKKMLASSQ